MEVGIVEDDVVFRVNLIGKNIDASVIGARRPKVIVSVYVAHDDIVVEENGKEPCRKIWSAGRPGRDVNVGDDEVFVGDCNFDEKGFCVVVEGRL